MKKYIIYTYDFYDESIEESNTAFCCLTEKFGNFQEKISEESHSPVWRSGSLTISLDQILNNIWDKDDIDMFVEINLECAHETFNIYKNYIQDFPLEFSRGNYIKYCPLQEKRDKILKELFL